jgi:hypothetical protein
MPNKLEIPAYMYYPQLSFLADGRAIPSVPLPPDYLERIPLFYQQGRRKIVEDYVTKAGVYIQNRRIVKSAPDIRLNWNEKTGLTNISMGAHGGFDLNDDRTIAKFQEHNLGGDDGIIAMTIAMAYVIELLKSR